MSAFAPGAMQTTRSIQEGIVHTYPREFIPIPAEETPNSEIANGSCRYFAPTVSPVFTSCPFAQPPPSGTKVSYPRTTDGTTQDASVVGIVMVEVVVATEGAKVTVDATVIVPVATLEQA